MKIAILGTSNSVMKNGYVKALSQEHEIINISGGRNSIFFMINTLLKNIELINSCDLIIIDHYINDIIFYVHKDIKNYQKHVKNFYSILKTLNTISLVLFFPHILNDKRNRKNSEHIQFLKSTLYELSLEFIDLNTYAFQNWHYNDRVHIKNNVSYLLGKLLSLELSEKISSAKIIPEILKQNPYTRVDAHQLKQNSNLNIKNFSNSLVNIDYIEISKNITFKIESDKELLSYGYVNPKGGFSALSIDNYNILCPGNKYFHEAIESIPNEIKKELSVTQEKTINLSASNKNEEYQSIRNKKDKCDVNANIVELLFYTEEQELIISDISKNETFNFNLPTLNEHLTFFFPEESNIKLLKYFNKIIFTDKTDYYKNIIELMRDLYFFDANIILREEKKLFLYTLRFEGVTLVDNLRDFAIKLEERNQIKMAYSLMRICLMMRPSSSLLKVKIKEYQDKLK